MSQGGGFAPNDSLGKPTSKIAGRPIGLLARTTIKVYPAEAYLNADTQGKPMAIQNAIQMADLNLGPGELFLVMATVATFPPRMMGSIVTIVCQ